MDPRVELFEEEALAGVPGQKVISPNVVAEEILSLLLGDAGEVVAVPNNPQNEKLGSEGAFTRTCPPNMWETCPITNATTFEKVN